MVDVTSVPKLMVLTYTAWSKSISLALAAENCLDIVLGDEIEPDEPGPLMGTLNEDGSSSGVTESQISKHEKAEDRYL